MPERTAARAEKKRTKPRWVRWVKRALWGGTAVFLAAFITFGAYVWLVFNSLEPKVALLPKMQAQLRMAPTEILSADGAVLCRLASENREPVRYPQIPKRIIDATVAAEDKRFWEHSGVDFTAILRAVVTNLRSGSVRQGGSTITQQLAKRLLTSGKRTFRRKIEDACLALQIERQYTKEQIIELYLNQVYYGSQAYGIKAAADIYFGKPLDKLTLGQAALLARLPRRPSDENPYVNPEAAKTNRNVVLDIMLEEKMITQEQHDKAYKESLRLVSNKPMQQIGIRRAPYFVTWVLDQLRRELPNEDYARGGYRIYTTLNTKAQDYVEKAILQTIKDYRRRRVTEGAMVVMTVDGEVLAMAGGSNFKRSQYNVITQGVRQPGSAFKPFVYSAALEMGVLRPDSSISNAPFYIMDEGKRRAIKGGGKGGSVSLMSALTKSINTPAVRVCDEVGPSNVTRFARDVFGFTSELYPVPVLALGSSGVRPIELAQAYSVFATLGNRVQPYGIKRIVGPEGTILAEYRPNIVPNVLSKSTVEPMDNILHRVVSSGTGRAADSVTNAAGKTGTTSSFKDAWFCGYTNQLVAIAWVANATYNPERTPAWSYGQMDQIFGGIVSAAMWASAVKPIQEMLGEKYAERRYSSESDGRGPSDKVSVRICTDSGLKATRFCTATERKRMTGDEADSLARCNLHTGPPDNAEASPPTGGEQPPVDEPPVAPASPDSPPKPAAHPVADDRVRIEICVETGSRATTYCRQKRFQTFKRGMEPVEYCKVHRP